MEGPTSRASLTPGKMLERWGLRVSGRSLKDPTRQSTGAAAGFDEDQALVAYVEGTRGFPRAEPALRWIHVVGHDGFHGFRFTLSASQRFRVWELHGTGYRKIPETQGDWARYYGWPEGPLAETAAAEYRTFFQELRSRLRLEPFLRPSPREDTDWVEFGGMQAAALRAELGLPPLEPRRGKRPKRGRKSDF